MEEDKRIIMLSSIRQMVDRLLSEEKKLLDVF